VAPIDRRRRRRHLSRARLSTAGAAAAAALVLAVLVGGLLKVHSQSSGYQRAIDRSYAAQIRLVAAASDRQARELHALLASMPAQTRTSLEFSLDTLVGSAAAAARQAETAAEPAPAGGAGRDIAAAMADRAAAVAGLRTAVDRLLGMAPLPAAGATPASLPEARSRPISDAGAQAALLKVGRLLAQSDRSYDAGRQALRSAPGHATLPPSVWSGRTRVWTSEGALALVDSLTGSATLAPIRRVELLAHTLAFTPAPVPAPTATQGVAVVPPTGRLGVSVVVANDGNVAERNIVVRVTVREVASGGAQGRVAAQRRRARRVSLSARSSRTVSLPPVSVAPGHRYTVTVAVVPPSPDAVGALTSDTVSARIAPPGPPVVAQLLPARGGERGGTDVTILGSGFTWVSSVTFGSRPARFRVISSTQVTAVSPPGTGTVSVRVSNPGGASAPSVGDRFRYRRK
jgi:hypothetical protein